MLNIKKDALFLDGDCSLCNRIVRFIKSNISDPSILHIMPIDSVDAQNLIRTFPKNHQNTDTVYLFRNGKSYIRSAAAIRCFLYFNWFYKILFFLLWLIPLPIRDVFYIVISKVRYKIFPRVESCTFGK